MRSPNRSLLYGTLEGLLQQRHRVKGRLSGVLNGVDEKIWSPETDFTVGPALHPRYVGRWENKRQLQIAMGLTRLIR